MTEIKEEAKAKIVKERAVKALNGAEIEVKTVGNVLFVLATLKNGLVLHHATGCIDPGDDWIELGTEAGMKGLLDQLVAMEHYSVSNAVLTINSLKNGEKVVFLGDKEEAPSSEMQDLGTHIERIFTEQMGDFGSIELVKGPRPPLPSTDNLREEVAAELKEKHEARVKDFIESCDCCGNCIFSRYIQKSDEYFCRRNPPVIDSENVECIPAVAKQGWCGEFSPKSR